MEATVQVGGKDVFAKVKGLISDLITKLTDEADAEATQKAYCDKEMAETQASQEDKSADVEKLTAKIDEAAAMSAMLKEDVKELQAELAALMKSQATMDKTRMDEQAAYTEAKADLELGLGGVQKALDVLRTYYGGAFLQDASESFVQQPPSSTSRLPLHACYSLARAGRHVRTWAPSDSLQVDPAGGGHYQSLLRVFQRGVLLRAGPENWQAQALHHHRQAQGGFP